MAALRRKGCPLIAWIASAILVAGTGCHALHHNEVICSPDDFAREKDMISHADYVVEPPDILIIDAVRAIPKPPYKIEPLDALFVQLGNPLPNEPLSGTFSVDPEGTINLGPSYGGSVSVNGLTIPEAKAAVEAQIIKVLKEPQVTVSLAQSRGCSISISAASGLPGSGWKS